MRHQTDFLVIGSGIAGLTFALQAAQSGRVIIITKRNLEVSNTWYAQGGVASVIETTDSFASHVEDTLTAGAGLCHRDVVETIVQEGPQRIEDLIRLGAHFSTTDSSPTVTMQNLSLGKEGGHSHRRIVYAADFTGEEIERTLVRAVKSNPNIEICENFAAVELITQHHIPQATHEPTQCFGAYALDIESQIVHTFCANVTLLASGGAARVYKHTTNPSIATGDGIAMAYRAGATITNMEFIQFHPTSLYSLDDEKAFLISEAVRGEGAILRNHNGEAFMEKYHPLQDLAPRDIVARSIDKEMKKSGDKHVWLDLTHLNGEKMKHRFPTIYAGCLERGFNFTREPIPVVPAAHYTCGGVLASVAGETDLQNLFACGEVACTGLHGANRLASNSLLEALVTAHRAAEKAVQYPQLDFSAIPDWDSEGIFDQDEWVVISHNRDTLRRMMWEYVGIVRSNERLEHSRKRIMLFQQEIEKFFKKNPVRLDLVQTRNMATIALLIVESALLRQESRGLHYNKDYPQTNDAFKKDTFLKKEFA